MIEPFSVLQRSKSIIRLESERALLSRSFMVELMRPALASIRFDADFYRRTYKDLAEAERNGVITDLHEHYINFGFFESRVPSEVEVDGSFYAREYPDVAAAIIENKVPSAQHHFDTVGFAEGRLPRKGWSFADLFN
jgi:hypothetical protein